MLVLSLALSMFAANKDNAIGVEAASGKTLISTTTAAGCYITCLACDKQGRIWIGSEDLGIACLDSHNHNLTIWQDEQPAPAQYPLTIAVASHDSLHVGTSNNGMLNLANGAWSSVGIMEGLCGTRVNALLSSQDESLWIATETGVVHRQATGIFHSYISSDGLPDGEIVSMAEDFGGRIWAGSSIGQIAFFSKGEWHRLPNAPCQDDAAINQIIVMPDGTIWLATPVGIFATAEGSSQWTHYRPSEISGDCIEDYVTCITRQDNGDLFFGLRKAGFLRYSPAADKWRLFSAKACGLPDSFVSSILHLDGGQTLIGTYGGGLCLDSIGDGKGISLEELAVFKKQFLPAKNSVPVSFSAGTEQGQIHGLQEKAQATEVVYFGEDWQTQGEWIGKYGSYAYVLAAMGMPNDYVGGEHADEFHYVPYMGANRRNNDSPSRCDILP